MPYYLKRLPALINPRNPRPYYAGFGPGPLAEKQTFWAEHRTDAIAFTSAAAARSEAEITWSDWRDLVHIVRAE